MKTTEETIKMYVPMEANLLVLNQESQDIWK